MKTKDFPYLSFPFAEFNPPQAEAIKFATQDCNLIVALGTAVGKTAVSLCFFGHELSTQTDTKCMYASPLRAISEERSAQFRSITEWKDVPTVINTGDHSATPEMFADARLVIVTTETLDSKARNPKTHGSWLEKVGVLVIDELHMLDEPSRGPALESGLINFTSVNKKARLVGLSATMSNADEIAKWFKLLNGKETYVVASEWRPVKLNVHLVGVGKDLPESETSRTAIDLVQKHSGDKILVFVHTKKLGRRLVEELRSSGIRQTEFYHAGLTRQQRALIEDMFKNPTSGLNVLVTTSALAMGVNL